MDFYTNKVLIDHEIDHNPKPEDAGIIKVYATIVFPEDPQLDRPTVLVCTLPAKEYLDNLGRYSWEQLNFLADEQGLNGFHVLYARLKLSGDVSSVLILSVDYSPDCALSMYITFKASIPLTAEEYSARFVEEEDWIFEEDMQVSPDENTIDIRSKPASKFAVDSLPRKVYKKTTSSSNMCTICLDGFKMGEIVATLPCGHEFDDSCILGWFATNHVCPLCRFELSTM